MRLKHYPEWLDYYKVKEKLVGKILGIEFSAEHEIFSGAKEDFVIIECKSPSRVHSIPICVYLPRKVIIRNRFHCICNALDLDISEFDNECGYEK